MGRHRGANPGILSDRITWVPRVVLPRGVGEHHGRPVASIQVSKRNEARPPLPAAGKV
jgi:hypothetical protein